MKHQTSVPIAIAAKVYGKDPAWVRAGIINGYLPIGTATRGGKRITSIEEIKSSKGRINYYISPKLFYEHTGVRYGIVEPDDQKTMSIPKNRYLELKYFCRQYEQWKQNYDQIVTGRSPESVESLIFRSKVSNTDRTSKEALAALIFKDKIRLVEKCCKKVAGDQGSYLLECVMKGLSYDDLKKKYRNFHLEEKIFQKIYERFFTELSERRD